MDDSLLCRPSRYAITTAVRCASGGASGASPASLGITAVTD